MRVLTVRQPWAWAIIHAGKDIENRTRNIAGGYRGPVAIHAASRYVEDWVAAANAIERITGEVIPPFDSGHGSEVLGAVIGVVDLTDVHSASVIDGCGRLDHDCLEHGTCRHHCSPWAEGPSADGWYQHLVLANPVPLATPIPTNGHLGLWRPDDQLRAAIEQQLASLAGREEQ